MTVLVQSISDFFKLMIQGFNLSTIFPAFIFVGLIDLYILPKLPANSLFPNLQNDQMGSKIGLTIILVGVIAYLLDAANFQIIRLFEGFWFRNWFPFTYFEEQYREYVRQMVADIEMLETVIENLKNKAKQKLALYDRLITQQESPKSEQNFLQKFSKKLDFLWPRTSKPSSSGTSGPEMNLQITQEMLDSLLHSAERLLLLADELASHKKALAGEIGDRLPTDEDFVLPTPYGNVIAAAEQYPKKLFNMDTIVLWPYLVPTLTKNGYAQYVVREKSMMDFLINLAFILGVFGFLLAIVEMAFTGLSWILFQQQIIVWGSVLFLYFLSVWGAGGWASSVSIAFVLFRDDLRKALRLRQVNSYDEEVQLWENASSFLRSKDSPESRAKWGRMIYDLSSYQSLDES